MISPSISGVALALLVASCARISAPDADFAAPQPRVTLQASEASGVFSHFTGNVTVTASSLQRASGAAGVLAYAPAGSGGTNAAFQFNAAPEFSHGDTLNVTWGAPAETLLGTSYTVQQQAQYRFYGRVGK